MGQVLFRALACGAGGVVGWLVVEPFLPTTGRLDPSWAPKEALMITLIGALIGLAAGVIQGLSKGGKRNVFLSAALGLVFGAIGAGLGHQIGGRIYESMGSDAEGLAAMPARIAAFIPMGAMIGMAVGWIQLSTRGLLSGLLGGLIAGAVTGAIFDPLSIVLAPATPGASPGPSAQ